MENLDMIAQKPIREDIDDKLASASLISSAGSLPPLTIINDNSTSNQHATHPFELNQAQNLNTHYFRHPDHIQSYQQLHLPPMYHLGQGSLSLGQHMPMNLINIQPPLQPYFNSFPMHKQIPASNQMQLLRMLHSQYVPRYINFQEYKIS